MGSGFKFLDDHGAALLLVAAIVVVLILLFHEQSCDFAERHCSEQYGNPAAMGSSARNLAHDLNLSSTENYGVSKMGSTASSIAHNLNLSSAENYQAGLKGSPAAFPFSIGQSALQLNTEGYKTKHSLMKDSYRPKSDGIQDSKKRDVTAMVLARSANKSTGDFHKLRNKMNQALKSESFSENQPHDVAMDNSRNTEESTMFHVDGLSADDNMLLSLAMN